MKVDISIKSYIHPDREPTEIIVIKLEAENLADAFEIIKLNGKESRGDLTYNINSKEMSATIFTREM